MAKDNGTAEAKNWIYILIGSLTLAGMFAGGVLAWGDLGDRMDNHAEVQVLQLEVIVGNADDIENEGCKPAKANTLEVALTKKDVKAMQADIKEIKIAQEAGFKAVLERLPK